MKSVVLAIVVILSSCVPNYYQVFTVKQSSQSNKLVEVKYNFWNNECVIYNHTQNPITVHLDQSFLIVNNKSFSYYTDKTTTYSSGSNTSYGYSYYGFKNVAANRATGISESFSTSVRTQKDVVIPSQTYRIIEGVNIQVEYLNDCSLTKYPAQPSEAKYEEKTTPFKISNIITYSDDSKHQIKNDLYVGVVTNVSYSKFIKTVSIKQCKETVSQKTSPYADSSNFFIVYRRQAETAE